MKKIFALLLVLTLIVSCNKKDSVEPANKYAVLKLQIWDEFSTTALDSVKVVFPELKKSYTVTKNKPYISDLPKQNLTVEIRKTGYIDVNKQFDLSRRDTINDHIIMPYDDMVLTVPTDSLYASYQSKLFSFTALRNKGFNIIAPDWIRVDTATEKTFEIKINIRFLANKSNEHRHANIILTNGESKRVIPVFQYRKNDIESVFVELGDISKWEVNMIDPIQNIRSIQSKNQICLSEITENSFKNKTVSFSTGCARIGMAMTAEIVIQNKGGLDTARFKFNGYDKKIDLYKYHNNLWNLYTLDGNDNIYFTINEGKRIGTIDLDKFEIISDPKVNFNTRNLVYNKYNNGIYITSTDDKLRRIDVRSGEVLEEIQFYPQPDDHPQSPRLTPSEVVFNKNGLALVTLIGQSISGMHIATVDVANKNKFESITGYLSAYSYQSLTVMPNGIDFGMKQNYHGLFTWDPIKKESNFDNSEISILPFKELALLEHQLINYRTKARIGQPIPGYSRMYDTKNNFIYSLTSDQQQNTYIVCHDHNANELFRKPIFENSSGSSYLTLAGNGKYLVYYNGYSEELFRFSIDFFKGKTKLENWIP